MSVTNGVSFFLIGDGVTIIRVGCSDFFGLILNSKNFSGSSKIFIEIIILKSIYLNLYL